MSNKCVTCGQELPDMPKVGDVYRYICNPRPDIESEALFIVRKVPPMCEEWARGDFYYKDGRISLDSWASKGYTTKLERS